jgi:hypothetical protein
MHKQEEDRPLTPESGCIKERVPMPVLSGIPMNPAYVSPALNACQAFDIILVRWDWLMCRFFPELLRPVYPGERILRMNGAWPISAGNGHFRGDFGELVLREFAWDKALKGVHDS